jgi:hypothetical protein
MVEAGSMHGKNNKCKTLVRISERKRELERLRCRQRDSIKIYFKEGVGGYRLV